MSVTRLQTADRGDKRDLILRVATGQFNERGFNDTRLEDIAELIGTTKTSISYHFKSKQALLAEAYDQTCEAYSHLLDAADKGSDGLASLQHWISGLGELHSQILTGRVKPLALLNDVSAFDQRERERFAMLSGEHFARLEGFIDEGIADGSIAVTSPRGTAYFYWNAANWIQRWLATISALRHEAAIGGLTGMLAGGLANARDMQFSAVSTRVDCNASSALFNREARARLKKEAFERAGIRSFNRDGYSNISLNALAQELGASRGSFYYSFADKDALLESCTDRSLGQFSRAIDEAMASSHSAVEKIQFACSMLYAGHFSDLDPLMRPSLFLSLSQRKQAVTEAEMQHTAARLAQLVAQCFDDDSGAPEHVEKLEALLLAIIASLTAQHMISAPDGDGFIAAPPSSRFFEPLFNGVAAQ